MKTQLVLLVLGVALLSGCHKDDKNSPDMADWEAQMKQSKAQLDEADQQAKRVDAQQAKADEQQKRMDKVLDKWEEQARRMDAILDKLERTGSTNK